MDSSLHGLQGRVLSFEEARNWFLEHNANRVAPSLMYNSDERRRNSQTTLNTIHNSVISVPYQTLPTRQRSLSREGSTNRPKTLAGSSSTLIATVSTNTTAMSPPFPGQTTQKVRTLAAPIHVDSYVPLDSNYLAIESSISASEPENEIQSYSQMSSMFSKISIFAKEFLDVILNLPKIFLILLIISIFMIVFSISMIFCLTVIWPNSVSLNPYDAFNRKTQNESSSFTTPKWSDQIASPAKNSDLTSYTTPSSWGVRNDSNSIPLLKYEHLPFIGSCSVNWTRISFTWSYHNSIGEEVSLKEKSIKSQLKFFCLLKVVLRKYELTNAETVLLASNADHFEYYRGGPGERHGNNVFLFSLSPCFTNNTSTAFPYVATNKHLSPSSNYSSLLVVAGPLHKHKYECNSLYDVNDFKKSNVFAEEVRKNYAMFMDMCASTCAGT